MLKSRTNWKLTEKVNQPEVIERLSKEVGATPLFIELCLQRGLDTAEKVQSFLRPNASWIHDPFLMHDMEKAISRIMQAIEVGENITVYGDYDADGVTSTAVLKETIEMLGGQVDFYIPNRFTDGYGPNVRAFEQLIQNGTQLIVTCDNGISGHEAITRAGELGVDVIVTDHHELPPELPKAFAIVHPRHPMGSYPFGELAGVGVAFKVASALLGEMPLELLDLVAIGTIGDLVSLTGENRALVMQGMEMLKETQRIGLAALFRVAGIKRQEMNEESIGFALGPRLNAIGRLGDAGPAVDLLTTFDDIEAEQLAKMIDEKNIHRQEMVAQITEEAFEMIESGKQESDVHVLAKEGWHEGVLGIVASKVVGKTGKPAIVLSLDKSKGTAKGSGRSVAAYNLFQALNSARHLTINFGGHHMAAGLTIPSANIEPIQQQLNQFAIDHDLTSKLGEEIQIAGKLQLTDISPETIEEIDQLAPFGTDNPRPVFLIENINIQEMRKIGANGNHLKLTAISEGNVLDVVGFHFGPAAEDIGSSPVLSLAGRLQINEWNGRRKPQMMLEDFAAEGVQIMDFRSSQVPASIWRLQGCDYVFFDKQNYESYTQNVAPENHAYLVKSFEEAQDFKMKTNQLVLVDCPASLEILGLLLKGTDPDKLYACFYSREDTYMNGMPNRNEFKKLFKYIASHVDIDVKNKFPLLAKHLTIKEKVLKFMISVFFEIGFVKIENGVMNIRENIPKKELSEAETYRERVSKISAEEFLIYSHFAELESWLQQQIVSTP